MQTSSIWAQREAGCAGRMPQRKLLALTFAVLLAGCGGDSDRPPAVPPEVQTDPLVGYQWHLQNDGQDVLAGEKPLAGVDLNGISALHTQGLTGKGITVAVVDDGLEVGHEDLADNVVPNGGYNFLTRSSDPSPRLENGNSLEDTHGTSAAGLIAMRGWNGKGGRGVSPEARLRGFNFLKAFTEGLAGEDGEPIDTEWAHYFSLGEDNAKTVDVDIFNMSYGADGVTLEPDDDSVIALERVLASTRQGKGAVYLNSAGNQFRDSPNFPDADCTQAAQFNVGCFDTATFALASAFGLIKVAAVNASGQRSSYSSEGAGVWVAGLGGEYHLDPDYFTATLPPDVAAVAFKPSLITADWTGCEVGYHSDPFDDPPSNALNNGSASTIDPGCNYTAFNGTSAAAPTVSGVVALMLQARPELTARDVAYILAITARNDQWRPGLLAHPARLTALGREFDPGWRANAAGLRFSRWFGYGLVDASAAVASAKTFTPLPPVRETRVEAEVVPADPAAVIPFGGAAGDTASGHLKVAVARDLVAEALQISFETTHTSPSKLLLTLVSPAGTRVPVIVPYTSLVDVPGGVASGIVSVNGFLGESTQGEWTLEAVDISQGAGAGDTGTALTDLRLRVLGHVPRR